MSLEEFAKHALYVFLMVLIVSVVLQEFSWVIVILAILVEVSWTYAAKHLKKTP